MSVSIILAILWVLASTVVAMLPMQRQFGPGGILFLSAPILIIWLGIDFGWIISVLAFGAFVSMYRNPIRYFWRKWTGREPQEPVQ